MIIVREWILLIWQKPHAIRPSRYIVISFLIKIQLMKTCLLTQPNREKHTQTHWKNSISCWWRSSQEREKRQDKEWKRISLRTQFDKAKVYTGVSPSWWATNSTWLARGEWKQKSISNQFSFNSRPRQGFLYREATRESNALMLRQNMGDRKEE